MINNLFKAHQDFLVSQFWIASEQGIESFKENLGLIEFLIRSDS